MQSKTLKSHQQPCKWKPSHAFSSVAEQAQRSASGSLRWDLCKSNEWGYYVSVCRKKENRESKLSRLNFTFLPAIGEKREAGAFHKRSAESSRCIFKAEGAAALKNRSWRSRAARRGVLRSTESFSRCCCWEKDLMQWQSEKARSGRTSPPSAETLTCPLNYYSWAAAS